MNCESCEGTGHVGKGRRAATCGNCGGTGVASDLERIAAALERIAAAQEATIAAHLRADAFMREDVERRAALDEESAHTARESLATSKKLANALLPDDDDSDKGLPS